jgi:hypothetical protein
MKRALLWMFLAATAVAQPTHANIKHLEQWQTDTTSNQAIMTITGDYVVLGATCETAGWDHCGYAEAYVNGQRTRFSEIELFTDEHGITHQNFGIQATVNNNMVIIWFPVVYRGILYDLTLLVLGTEQ